jgi:hypothetical protein
LPLPWCSGRKRAALTYCVAYALGCFTKHFNSFWVLAGGRVLCGIATSLLFSAFESWLVAEHFKVGAAAAAMCARSWCTFVCCSAVQRAWVLAVYRQHCLSAAGLGWQLW